MKKEWVRFLSVKAFVPLISFFIDAINHRQYFILYFNRKQSEMFFNTVSICTQRPLHEKGVSSFFQTLRSGTYYKWKLVIMLKLY